MSFTKSTRFIAGYLLFVGMPVAGLVACIKYGNALKAPVSMDGLWHVRSGSMRLADLPCMAEAVAAREPAVSVSQSGKFLSLSATSGPKIALTGTIEERTITLSAASPAIGFQGTGCEPYRHFNITATLGPGSQPKSLAGILSADGCASCAPVPFEAVRQAQSGGGGTD